MVSRRNLRLLVSISRPAGPAVIALDIGLYDHSEQQNEVRLLSTIYFNSNNYEQFCSAYNKPTQR